MRRWIAVLALALSAPASAEVHCTQGSTCIDAAPGFDATSSYAPTGDWVFDSALNNPVTCTDGIKDSTLTAGRILFAGTAGRIQGDADCIFATDTASCTKLIGSTSSCTVGAVDAAGSICTTSAGVVFEGATANAHEATLTATDPTADTIYSLQALAAGSYNVTAQSGALTATRVPYVATGGVLTDAAGLTWTNGTATLSTTNLTVTGDTTTTGRLMVPMGQVAYFNTTGTAVTISGQSDGSTNMVVVAPTSAVAAESYEFDNGGADNGRLRYTDTVTKDCHIAMTFSLTPATNNDVFVVGVARSGTVLPTSRVIVRPGATTDTDGSAIHVFATLATNQYLEMYVGNLTGARNVTVKSINLFAMCM